MIWILRKLHWLHSWGPWEEFIVVHKHQSVGKTECRIPYKFIRGRECFVCNRLQERRVKI